MKLRKPSAIFSTVVMALFLREIQTRFGVKKLGYFWAITDALSQIFVFSIIKTLLMEKSMAHIDYPVFLATGFLAYNFFKNSVKMSLSAFSANKTLFS